MNNTDTIKAVSPIVNSFFRDEISATKAMDLIGGILKENTTANPKPNRLEMTITQTADVDPASIARMQKLAI